MENINVEQQMARIKAARDRAEKIANERNRLQGEVDSLAKQIAELEEECRTKYKCEVKDLPALMEKIKNAAEAHLAEAEKILNPPQPTESASTGSPLDGLL